MGFSPLFNEQYRTDNEFSLSNDQIQYLIRNITNRISKNRIRYAFRRKVNPFIEWQILIESLVEAGMKAKDFKVDWQLIFRMIALRNTVRQQIDELKRIKA